MKLHYLGNLQRDMMYYDTASVYTPTSSPIIPKTNKTLTIKGIDKLYGMTTIDGKWGCIHTADIGNQYILTFGTMDVNKKTGKCDKVKVYIWRNSIHPTIEKYEVKLQIEREYNSPPSEEYITGEYTFARPDNLLSYLLFRLDGIIIRGEQWEYENLNWWGRSLHNLKNTFNEIFKY